MKPPKKSASATTPPTTPPAIAPVELLSEYPGVGDTEVEAEPVAEDGAAELDAFPSEDEPDCVTLRAMILCSSVNSQPPSGSVRLAPLLGLRDGQHMREGLTWPSMYLPTTDHIGNDC